MFKNTMPEAIKLPRRMLRIFVSLSLGYDFFDVKTGGPQGPSLPATSMPE
jgi:hypothetical protein